MNQVLGHQDTPCLGDRDRGRTEMLSKQAAQLSLSNAQAPGQPIDTGFVECACGRSAPTPATPYSTSRARQQTRAPLLADIAGRDGSPLPAPPLPSDKTSCSRA